MRVLLTLIRRSHRIANKMLCIGVFMPHPCTRAVGCIVRDGNPHSQWGAQGCNATSDLRPYQLESADGKWFQMSQNVLDASCLLLIAIIGSIIFVLSATSVPKPPKTAVEHAEAVNSRRRGALTRHPVNGPRYHTQNAKLAAWQTYSGFILFLIAIFMLAGTFRALQGAIQVVDIKSGPGRWAAEACRGTKFFLKN